MTMNIHGRGEMEKQFSAFTASVEASHHMNGQQVITIADSGRSAIDVHYCRANFIVEEPERT
ncbi:MAG: hypothetical protein SPI25_02130 [Dialister sp.]|nr:hypothetical protein [Dialister sp.]